MPRAARTSRHQATNPNTRRVQPHRQARPTWMPDSPGRIIQHRWQLEATSQPLPPPTLAPTQPSSAPPTLGALAGLLDQLRVPPHQERWLPLGQPAPPALPPPLAPPTFMQQVAWRPDLFEAGPSSSIAPLVPYPRSPTSTDAQPPTSPQPPPPSPGYQPTQAEFDEWLVEDW